MSAVLAKYTESRVSLHMCTHESSILYLRIFGCVKVCRSVSLSIYLPCECGTNNHLTNLLMCVYVLCCAYTWEQKRKKEEEKSVCVCVTENLERTFDGDIKHFHKMPELSHSNIHTQ